MEKITFLRNQYLIHFQNKRDSQLRIKWKLDTDGVCG